MKAEAETRWVWIKFLFVGGRFSFVQIIYTGCPKSSFSNFMHYNFLSKLYFYMTFLEDVYFCTEYMYSEFQ